MTSKYDVANKVAYKSCDHSFLLRKLRLGQSKERKKETRPITNLYFYSKVANDCTVIRPFSSCFGVLTKTIKGRFFVQGRSDFLSATTILRALELL